MADHREDLSDSPASEDEWTARRAALSSKLAERSAERAKLAEGAPRGRGGMQGMAEGLKLASEFAAGIIVGGGIGFGIDHLAGSAPFGLIVFLMLGFAAGIRNVLRTVGPAPPPKSPLEPGAGDEPRPPR